MPVDYTGQVHAVFAARCLVCHSQDKRSGGLSLATYADVLNGGRNGAAVKPGNSGGSLIVQRITGSGATRMPIGGPALSAAEIGILTTWIDQGATLGTQLGPAKAKWGGSVGPRASRSRRTLRGKAGPIHWTASPRATSPGMAWPVQAARPDATLFARRAWLRRVEAAAASLEELRESFIGRSLPALGNAIAGFQLLDNQKYAEHWMSFWNDLLRNEDGVTYFSETAGRKSITDWLLAALVSNRSIRRMADEAELN